jgi:hypothetical protein
MAQIGSLSVALASGRVQVGTTLRYGDSAFSQYAPATINGMLDANAVRPTGPLAHVLIPTTTPGPSKASTALDIVQYFQFGGITYDYFPRFIPMPQREKK